MICFVTIFLIPTSLFIKFLNIIEFIKSLPNSLSSSVSFNLPTMVFANISFFNNIVIYSFFDIPITSVIVSIVSSEKLAVNKNVFNAKPIIYPRIICSTLLFLFKYFSFNTSTIFLIRSKYVIYVL